ncbi:hypothetical protein PV327_003679 [Microctonus hyperodae]|uniref:Zinc finger protein Xfin n=1 Tax=Microctonus hyperodae TaxID=165561 RepID=A0AA39L148_MICHY|nr:hypothetical protein PV327_003679 [Microctonus hyperodae]
MESRERYDELCRLCASYDAVKMDIFGQEGKNRQLVDKIQTCLPFKIDEEDRLPKCLCYRCMYNLENFYDFRTACVNAVALLERSLPQKEFSNGQIHNEMDKHSELRSELLKEKEKMPILIPEAPIVNPNAALGTPPRLNSDGEGDQEIEEILEQSGTDEGMDDNEDRKSDEYEMDMETNPSDFLEMPPMVTEDIEEIDNRNHHQQQQQQQQLNSLSPPIFQHTSEQHEVYVCSLCNKAFSSKGHLSLHARIHVGGGDVIGEKVITDDHTSYKRPYQCDLCNKSYSTAKHRWGHVSTTHRGHPAVTCRYCARIYSTRSNLDEHIKSRHTGAPPPTELPTAYVQQENRYRCKTCPKMYTNVTELNRHSRNCMSDRQKDATARGGIVIQSGKSKGKSLMDTSDASTIESEDDGKDYRTAEAKLSKNPQLTILKQALTRNEGLKRNSDGRILSYKSARVSQVDGKSRVDSDGQKRWYCETCPQSFVSIDLLKEHEITHETEKPYVCILCEKDFVLKSSLSRHIVTSHGVDPVPIIDSDKCLKKTIMGQIGGKHMSRVDELKGKREPSSEISFSSDRNDDEERGNGENVIEIETVFVCEICTRDFNDRASLWLHIRATHKEFAAFACGVCLKICSDNEQLLNHVNMYHGGTKMSMSDQRRYSCTICGRQHDSRKKLMSHVSIHNVDPGYDPAGFVQLNSNYYNENFNSNEGVNIDQNNIDFDAEDGEKVDCFICYKSFPNEDHLIRHQRNAHKSEPISASGELTNLNGTGTNSNGNKGQYHLFFVCEICSSSHSSKWERWLHVSSIHHEEPSIRCERDDCGKIFATKSLKNDHVQHHLIQGESPNTCEICGKLWGSRVDYWKHVMGVHSDTVPLICGVCLKVFPDVIQLSTHVKSKHWPLTNGDFSCDICGRPYSNKSKMSRHRKIHGLEIDIGYNNGINETLNDTMMNFEGNLNAIEIDLTCGLCSGLTFVNWKDLSHHRRTKHALFPCDLCNKCYGRTSHLWKHVNRVHKGHEDVTCKYCMKTSASKDHLAAHIAKIHRYELDTKQFVNETPIYRTANVEDDNAAAVHHCEKCNKGFHKRYLLRRHMKGCQNYRKDPGTLLTRCRACERIFKDRASLQKHIENHHSSYTCHLCNETITSKLGIMTHNRVNHMDHPDLTCDNSNCKKLFRTKEDLELHRKDHKYHNSPNVCDYCGDTVENKLKLKMHVLSLHRNEIGVSCGVCLIPMRDPQDLKKHVEDVHSSVLLMPNTCQVCGKQYASKWKAFDHTKKCHGKVFRTCKRCLAVFTTDADIRYHYEHVHNVPKDQLAGFEHHFDVSSKGDDHDNSRTAIKDEPDYTEYDDGIYNNVHHFKGKKRRRSHHDTYDCEICPEIFLNRDTLSEHYQTIHNTDPERMFKKIKTSNSKKTKKNRGNFECQNCNKQFGTNSQLWNHISVCSRRNSIRDESPNNYSTSILESHLKNNNQIKKEPIDLMLSESNLNIPDFNLFEDINLQLSGQKPLPNLMPLSNIKISQGNNKCYRKDSRKVYDESTNTVCACEVCGKQWPAKKHLWQHLIRFHRAEAAVTCGVCLKLCSTYRDLSQHLKDTHEAILSCEGNNFTCKTCGRYHNARSKLLLHMSIHINNHEHIWCEKCALSFDSDEKLAQHKAKCIVKRRTEEIEFEEQSNDIDVKMEGEEDKGSLIGDEASLLGEGEEEVDFDSDAEEEEASDAENHDENSNLDHSEDSDSSTNGSGSEAENDNESRTNSRITGDVSCQTDSEDRDSDEYDEMKNADKHINKKRQHSHPSESKSHDVVMKKEEINNPENEKVEQDKHKIEKKVKKTNQMSCKEEKIADDSDDDGPPILSPMMPIVNNDTDGRIYSSTNTSNHKLSPIASPNPEQDNEVELPELDEIDDADENVRGISTNSNTADYDDYLSTAKSNASVAASLEEIESDNEEEEEEEEERDENMADDDSRLQVEQSTMNLMSEKGHEENIQDNDDDEIDDNDDDNNNDDDNDEDNEDNEDNENVVIDEETGEIFEGEIGGDAMQIDDLEGTVLMVANDDEGNQILIQRNVAEMSNDESMEGVTSYIYQAENEEENYDEDEEEVYQMGQEEGGECQDDDEETNTKLEEEDHNDDENDEEEEDEEEDDIENHDQMIIIQSEHEEESNDLEANSSAKNDVSRT